MCSSRKWHVPAVGRVLWSMNLVTVALDLRPRAKFAHVSGIGFQFVAWSMLPSRPSFAFPNAHLNASSKEAQWRPQNVDGPDFLVSASVISVALITEIWTSKAMDSYITWKWSSWRERQTGRTCGSWWKRCWSKSRSHAFQSFPREFSMWTSPEPAPRVRFLRGWFRCYPACRAGPSLQQINLTRSCFSTRIGLICSTCTTHVSSLRAGGDRMAGWVGSWLCIVRQAKFAWRCQCLGHCTPPPSLSLSLSLSNDHYIYNYLNDHWCRRVMEINLVWCREIRIRIRIR